MIYGFRKDGGKQTKNGKWKNKKDERQEDKMIKYEDRKTTEWERKIREENL